MSYAYIADSQRHKDRLGEAGGHPFSLGRRRLVVFPPRLAVGNGKICSFYGDFDVWKWGFHGRYADFMGFLWLYESKWNVM